MPAPKGKGLCIEKECAKILKLAGIKDVWSKTLGHTSTKLNLIYACVNALKQLMQIKTKEQDVVNLGIVEGSIAKDKKEVLVIFIGSRENFYKELRRFLT